MYILEEYLQYLDEQKTKWKQKIIAGKLSPEQVEKLKKSGIVKPEEEYLAGLNKGSQNIINRYGVKFKRKNPTSFKRSSGSSKGQSTMTGAKYSAAKKTITIPKSMTGAEYAAAKRHEVDEVRAIEKLKRKFKITNKDILGNARYHSHFSPEVLANERKYLTMINRLYDKEQELLNYRHMSDNPAEHKYKAINPNSEYYDIVHKKLTNSRNIRKNLESKLRKYVNYNLDHIKTALNRKKGLPEHVYKSDKEYVINSRNRILNVIRNLPKTKRNVKFTRRILTVLKTIK
jgi:hypothetical protein